jgi:trehalose/maltose hydrolase-like predicted phosphorylase
VMPGVASAPAASTKATWSLKTTRAAAAAAAPACLGNGYVGTRIPADGAGYVSSPVATETHIAGVYASVPDEVGGGVQRQGSINLPGWTQLDVMVAGQRYRAPTRGAIARSSICAAVS